MLLFQDLAVIPVLALITRVGSTREDLWRERAIASMGGALLAVAGIVVGGHYLLRPLFRVIAATQIHEIFTAAGLLLVISAALYARARKTTVVSYISCVTTQHPTQDIRPAAGQRLSCPAGNRIRAKP